MIICIIPVIVAEKAEAENNTKEYKKMNIYKSTKLTQEEQKKFFEEYKEYDIRTVQAKRSINSNANKRGEISEVLIYYVPEKK